MHQEAAPRARGVRFWNVWKAEPCAAGLAVGVREMGARLGEGEGMGLGWLTPRCRLPQLPSGVESLGQDPPPYRACSDSGLTSDEGLGGRRTKLGH